MEKGAYQGVSSQEELVPKSMFQELERQVKELERMLGKKTLENGTVSIRAFVDGLLEKHMKIKKMDYFFMI